jgi:hypothetical protein
MRRKRYQISCITPSGETKRDVHVLAYHKDHIALLMEKEGFKILSDPELVSSTTSTAKPAWTSDWAAVTEAKDLLKIQWPLKITRTFCQTRYGRHTIRYRMGDLVPRHYITARKTSTPEKASQTLWHELTHASQAEQAAEGKKGIDRVKAWIELSNKENLKPYDARPIELNARTAEYCAEHLPLTKGTK